MSYIPFGFLSNQIPITTSGLTIYCDANNNQSYTGSGTVWNDLSGNNYDGTLYNGVLFSTGSTNYFTFDGTNDYIQFPTGSTGSNTGSYTMSTWLSGITGTKVFLTRGQSSSDWSMRLEKDGALSTNVNAGVAVNYTTGGTITGVYAYNSGITFSANTWYYLTEVWESGVSVRLYINGTLERTTTTTRNNLRSNTTGWNFARYGTSYYSFATAEIDIYSRVLSDTEITNNFNALKSKYGY